MSNVIVVFKDGTPAETIDKAAKDLENSGMYCDCDAMSEYVLPKDGAAVSNWTTRLSCLGGKVGHRYDSTILGFSCTLPDDHVSTLSEHPHVDYMEPDGEVSTCVKDAIGKK